jgi:hypothetical protein
LVPAGAAGVLARHQPGEAHELRSRAEPGEVADLDDQGERGEGLDSAEGSEPPDQIGVRRLQRDRVELALELIALGHPQLDRDDVLIAQSREQRQVEVLGPDPGPVGPRPVRGVAEDPAVPEQELRQAMAGPEDVLTEVLAQPEQVADRFFVRRRDPDRGELAGPEQPAQLAGIAAIGLHPVAGLARGERWGDDHAVDVERAQLPLELVPARPGLIADPDIRRIGPSADEPTDLLGGVRDPLLVWIVLTRTEQRDADRILVHVETDERWGDTGTHGRCPPFVARPAPFRCEQSTYLGRHRPLHAD